MNDSKHDLGEILRSSERPRALTDDERQRVLARLTASDQSIGHLRPNKVIELHARTAEAGVRSRISSSIMWVGSGVAAVSLLFVFLTARDPARPEPIVPLDSVPGVTLPKPGDDPNIFCDAHVDAISNALERWRGVENWAFTGGTPDLGQLVDDALGAAAELDDAVLADRATAARDRLRAELEQIDPAVDDRDAIEPKVAAIDDALAAIVAIAGELASSCDLERLTAARDLG